MMDAMDGSCGIFLIQSCPNGPANCNAPRIPLATKFNKKRPRNLKFSVIYAQYWLSLSIQKGCHLYNQHSCPQLC